MPKTFILYSTLFLLAFSCGPLEPYEKEKIENSKIMEEDATGEVPDKDPTQDSGVEPKEAKNGDDSLGDVEELCKSDLSLSQKIVQTYEERKLPQNPLNLQLTSNHSFDKYWQDFKRFAEEGYQAYNDAASYGVNIVGLDLSPGAWYWRVIGVHHLLPYENRSKHHAFIEVLDKDGKQIRDNNLYAKLFANPTGNEGEVLRLDKPLNEPAGNHAMYKNGRVVMGVDRATNLTDLPTERVSGMHTEHADEPLPDGNYNTYGHHSYYSVFQLSQKPWRTIKVRLKTVGDESVQLIRANGTEVQSRNEGTDFSFENLNENNYKLMIADIQFPLNLDKNARTVEITISDGADCP